MSKHNIYRNQSKKIDAAFVEAGLPGKIFVVALDFAKQTHYACFCDGHGRYLRKAFTVRNDVEGVSWLAEQIERSRKAHGVRRKGHVIIGGEDSASYTRNFMERLRAHGYLTVRVNATEAHRQGDGHDSSTDKTALRAIARTILKRDAHEIDLPGPYHRLREFTRHRRRLVHTCTAAKNRIHTHADLLFPGFLSRNSPVAAFSKASLELMRGPFSARVMARRKQKSLVSQLTRQGVRDAEKTAAALKGLAATAIPAHETMAASSSRILESELRLYLTLTDSIARTERECARLLADLPEAFLTSIKGIGITLASCICAETGPLAQCDSNALNGYGGIIPRVHQTGGPESEAVVRGKRRQFNRRLKDYLLQAGNHLYLHGPAELREDAIRRKQAGKAVDTAMARRFLRIARALCHSHYVYLPAPLRSGDAEADRQRADYFLMTWPELRIKWKRLGLHENAFAPEAPLGQWREIVQQTYDLNLTL